MYRRMKNGSDKKEPQEEKSSVNVNAERKWRVFEVKKWSE